MTTYLLPDSVLTGTDLYARTSLGLPYLSVLVTLPFSHCATSTILSSQVYRTLSYVSVLVILLFFHSAASTILSCSCNILLHSCEGTSPSAAQRGAFRHRPPTLGSSSSSSHERRTSMNVQSARVRGTEKKFSRSTFNF